VRAISINRQPETRVNERIRVPQVRVIADDGTQVGVLPVRDALALAQSKGLDLVEVSPTARPPVCRIMDYGKFKYEQNLRARKAKKKQHHTHLKEIKMRPKIDDHDYGFKLRHAREFLGDRDKVKFTITFRGREIAHTEIGHELMKRILAELQDVAIVETPPRQEGPLDHDRGDAESAKGGSSQARREAERRWWSSDQRLNRPNDSERSKDRCPR
jgi:translation initiation factor IF-3